MHSSQMDVPINKRWYWIEYYLNDFVKPFESCIINIIILGYTTSTLFARTYDNCQNDITFVDNNCLLSTTLNGKSRYSNAIHRMIYTWINTCSRSNRHTFTIQTTPEATSTPVSCQCETGYVSCGDCKKCVQKELVCDGISQCGDDSDERNCPCMYKGEKRDVSDWVCRWIGA